MPIPHRMKLKIRPTGIGLRTPAPAVCLVNLGLNFTAQRSALPPAFKSLQGSFKERLSKLFRSMAPLYSFRAKFC